MKKLVIQIPCYNESETLAVALRALPRKVSGFDCVEWLVIDDGSTDGTAEVARANGVDHVVRHSTNQGLARAFQTGIRTSLSIGADTIVNTDADNQYCADDIPKLLAPILSGGAQMVIGARPIQAIEHFSRTKKILQQFGSWVVRVASGTNVLDAPSGFRAIHREAALQLNVFNPYTYTLETLIQAGRKGIPTTSVPVRTNEDLRPSRLVKSIPSYVQRSILTILRIFMTYQPFRFFALLGSVPFGVGVVLGVRWLWFFFEGAERTRVPSLILAAILILVGVQLFMFGLVADLLAANRQILEDVQVRSRRAEFGASVPASESGEKEPANDNEPVSN